MGESDRDLARTWLVLRFMLGTGVFLAGLDKFFNLLTDWAMYLSPAASRVVPLTPAALMRGVGVVEMVVGLAILTKWTRIGAYVAMAWLVGIVGNLLAAGAFFDLAVRDLEIAVAMFALARLTEWRARVAVGERAAGERVVGLASLDARA